MNEITFTLLTLIETLQIIHFAFRDQIHGEWNSTVFKYAQLIINYISLDYLIFKNPSFFLTLSIFMCQIMIIVVFIMLFLGWSLAKSKMLPSMFRNLIALLNICLYLFKTVLQIPIIIVILGSFMPGFRESLGLDTENGI